MFLKTSERDEFKTSRINGKVHWNGSAFFQDIR